MTEERKNKIIQSLKNGNTISTRWVGSWSNGRLSYSLKDIKVLRESEIQELKRSCIIEPIKNRRSLYSEYKLCEKEVK